MRKPVRLVVADLQLAIQLGATVMVEESPGVWPTEGDCFYIPATSNDEGICDAPLEWKITPELLVVMNERGE